MKIPQVFAELCDYAISLGHQNICDLPGCLELRIDEHWWIAFNGHNTRLQCSEGATVPPFSIFIMFNGWPAGIVDAGGGTLCAGAIAHEDALIEAIRKAKGLAA